MEPGDDDTRDREFQGFRVGGILDEIGVNVSVSGVI